MVSEVKLENVIESYWKSGISKISEFSWIFLQNTSCSISNKGVQCKRVTSRCEITLNIENRGEIPSKNWKIVGFWERHSLKSGYDHQVIIGKIFIINILDYFWKIKHLTENDVERPFTERIGLHKRGKGMARMEKRIFDVYASNRKSKWN